MRRKLNCYFNQKLGYRILASFALKLPLLSFLFIHLFIYLVHISFLFRLFIIFVYIKTIYCA